MMMKSKPPPQVAPHDPNSAEQPAFPMHVLKVSDAIEVLRRGGSLPCFEDLKMEGTLRVLPLSDTRKVLFLSHTWLGFKHPDPRGVKMELLRSLLSKLWVGDLKVKGYCFTEMWQKGLTISPAKLQQDFVDGYVWLDFWCIPQRDPTTQIKAIGSIVDYVARSDLFVVLAGPWTHEDGSTRDERSWFGRGWCRMEQLANALSPHVKGLIIASSVSCVINYGPSGHQGHGGWAVNPVGRGKFTVDSDKAELGPVIAKLIAKRKAQALREGDMLWFRHLHCLKSALLAGTGYEPDPQESVAEWMAAMQFNSVEDGKKFGLTPLRYAVIAGRADLTAALLDMGADIDGGKVRRATPEMQNMWFLMPGASVLISAACFSPAHSHADCVRLLIQRGANVKATCMPPFNINLLFFATGVEVGEDGCDMMRIAQEHCGDQLGTLMMLDNFALEMGVLCGKTRVLKYQLEQPTIRTHLLADRPGPHYGGKQRLAKICM